MTMSYSRDHVARQDIPSSNTLSLVVPKRKTSVVFCQAQQGWSVAKQTGCWGPSIPHTLSFIVTTKTFIKLHHPL